MNRTKTLITAIGMILAALPAAGHSASGTYHIPWGHVSDGRGTGYDAFISIRNLNETAPATVSVYYLNRDGSRIKETGEFTVEPLATELVDVEDTVLNWGIGSGRIEWSTAGEDGVISAAYIIDRIHGFVVDMPVISEEEAEAADVRYVPYGRITDGASRGFDTYIFLKNTSDTESATATIVYYSHTGSATRTGDPITLAPTGSTRVNVENTIDPDFGWGGAEISWTPVAGGTVVAAAALVNWETMSVTSIPIK